VENEKFAPVYASQAFEHAGEYGLRFLAQAETASVLPFENLDPQYQGLVDAVETPEEKESWRSMLRNEEFRTDLYTKGPAPDSALEDSLLWGMSFSNIAPFSTMQREIACGSRMMNLTDPLVAAIVEICEDGTVTANQLCGHEDLHRYSPRQIMETMQILELSGLFAFSDGGFWEADAGLQGKWTLQGSFGRALMDTRLAKDRTAYVPAPAIGSAIIMEPLDALALQALDGRTLKKASYFMLRALNETAPDLLNFTIDQTWVENYLENFKRSWGPILLKLGAVEIS